MDDKKATLLLVNAFSRARISSVRCLYRLHSTTATTARSRRFTATDKSPALLSPSYRPAAVVTLPWLDPRRFHFSLSSSSLLPLHPKTTTMRWQRVLSLSFSLDSLCRRRRRPARTSVRIYPEALSSLAS